MADNALNLCGHHIEMRQFFYAHTKKYIAVTVDKVTQNESLRYGNINTISGIAEFYNDVWSFGEFSNNFRTLGGDACLMEIIVWAEIFEIVLLFVV